MATPHRKLLDDALDTLKLAAQEIERLKTSVSTLKLVLAVQAVGTNLDQIRSYLAALQQIETRLGHEQQQDIALAFEVLKHLIRKNPGGDGMDA